MSKIFLIRRHELHCEQIIVDAFIDQHYSAQTPPAQLILDGKFDISEWQESLAEAAGRKVAIVTRPSGEGKVWMAMAAKNAKFAIEQRLAERATQEKRLQLMQEALDMAWLRRTAR